MKKVCLVPCSSVLPMICTFILLFFMCSCTHTTDKYPPETEENKQTQTLEEPSNSKSTVPVTENDSSSSEISDSSESDLTTESEPVTDDITSSVDEPNGNGGTTSVSRHSFVKLDLTEDMLALPVQEKPAVGMDYFSDAVLVGNSLAEGLYLYSGIKGVVPYIEKGIVVKDCFDKKIIKVNGQDCTVIEALSNNANFKKVYLTFGLNEMGYPYLSEFVKQYQRLISEIQRIRPDAVIYVQSCLPVTAETSKNDRIFFNENIEIMNDTLRYIAKSCGVNYLDIASVMKDSGGALPSDWASHDGIHLTPSAYKIWFDYLMKHTA